MLLLFWGGPGSVGTPFTYQFVVADTDSVQYLSASPGQSGVRYVDQPNGDPVEYHHLPPGREQT